jgi:hypothetical protein
METLIRLQFCLLLHFRSLSIRGSGNGASVCRAMGTSRGNDEGQYLLWLCFPGHHPLAMPELATRLTNPFANGDHTLCLQELGASDADFTEAGGRVETEDYALNGLRFHSKSVQ